ncbi:MAG: glycosyltransferase family 2 protein [Planctomycetes bacterium]|nr:glycosyltransferase family 2 protein [Planctomycetota bacterium]
MAELVTAIVCTYRRPHLLERSLGSVLRQTYRPLELIVVDDGSGDDTPEVLKTWLDRAAGAGMDCRCFEKANGGPGPAKTFALEHARGELLAFLDDDDRWYPQKLETQINMMRTHPEAGASFTRFVHEGKEDQPKPRLQHMRDGWVFESLCSGETRAHMQTLIVRRDLAREVGGFGTERHWDDTEFELRLSLATPFLAVPEALTVICTVDNSISREDGLPGDLQRDADKLRILDGFVARFGQHPRFRPASAKLLRARLYDEHIKHLLWLGRVEAAREAWERALEECGEQPMLNRLKSKLARARVKGWFGMRLKKP